MLSAGEVEAEAEAAQVPEVRHSLIPCTHRHHLVTVGRAMAMASQQAVEVQMMMICHFISE